MGCSETVLALSFSQPDTISSVKPSSKGGYGSFLAAIGDCCREKLQAQGIEVPEKISKMYPTGFFLMVYRSAP
eukprot:1159516-Pelagomonas_calceolata.AAC.25